MILWEKKQKAYVNYVKNLEKQKNASVQTGSDNANIFFIVYIIIKLYNCIIQTYIKRRKWILILSFPKVLL